MSDAFAISFHGAASTVTGSKHLLEIGKRRILLDAGLFQGRKELRLKNWNPPLFDPKSIEHVLLSHTHIDHVGYLPRLVKLGLEAPVHMTAAAYALSELMLLDSAKIQEEDARYANKKGYSKHRPALPLYTSDDARATLELRQLQTFESWEDLGDGIRFRFLNSGHLLGSAFIELRIPVGGRELKVVYSGDIGRFAVPLHLDPEPLPACDVLLMESTYGGRTHDDTPVEEQIAEPFARTLGQGGTVLIPAFAVGRSQQVTLILRRMMKKGLLPDVPIHIDSPMAVDATKIYSSFLNERNIDPDVFEDGRLRLFPERVSFHRKVAQSKKLNNQRGPRIIVSASGMLTAGRVLHHLARLAPDPKNLLALVGYQAPGTRSRDLLEGKPKVRIHGRDVPARLQVVDVHGMSGHADHDELMRWVGSAPTPPKLVFLVHGEARRAGKLAEDLTSRYDLGVIIPRIGDRHDVLSLLPS